MHRLLTGRRAAETLEAAITTPVAVLVMIAIANLGMLVYGQQAVQQAARHGARMGSVVQQCAACAAVSAARQDVQASLVHNPNVSVLAPGGVTGSTLRLRVTGEVPNFISPLAALFPGLPQGPFTVSAESTFRQEGW